MNRLLIITMTTVNYHWKICNEFSANCDPQRQKKVECEICGKKLYDKGYLKTHMQTHLGRLPFQ